jgi:hypothetical protein
MTDGERDRVFQYSFRKYDALGPSGLQDARRILCEKLMKSTNISEDDFNELIEDMIVSNGWPEAKAMAYFEVINIEDRI